MSRRGRTALRAARHQDQLRLALAASGGSPIFLASNYEIDGATGKVGAFVDINNPARKLVQAVGANQVAVPTPHADFAGKSCATFAGAETYTSNEAAAAWAFGSDGSGMLAILVFTATTVSGTDSYFCTTSAANQRGFAFYRTTTTVRSSVERTGGNVVPDSSVGVIAANTPTYREISHGTGFSPQYEYRDRGALVSSGAYASAADAGAPTHTLRLGSNNGVLLPADMRWAALMFATSRSARAAYQEYILREFGILPA